jgi:hypothetical protein
MANFKRQRANVKTTDHLPFDLCYLPFAFVWVWERKGSAEFRAPLPFKEFVAGQRCFSGTLRLLSWISEARQKSKKRQL